MKLEYGVLNGNLSLTIYGNFSIVLKREILFQKEPPFIPDYYQLTVIVSKYICPYKIWNKIWKNTTEISNFRI